MFARVSSFADVVENVKFAEPDTVGFADSVICVALSTDAIVVPWASSPVSPALPSTFRPAIRLDVSVITTCVLPVLKVAVNGPIEPGRYTDTLEICLGNPSTSPIWYPDPLSLRTKLVRSPGIAETVHWKPDPPPPPTEASATLSTSPFW